MGTGLTSPSLVEKRRTQSAGAMVAGVALVTGASQSQQWPSTHKKYSDKCRYRWDPLVDGTSEYCGSLWLSHLDPKNLESDPRESPAGWLPEMTKIRQAKMPLLHFSTGHLHKVLALHMPGTARALHLPWVTNSSVLLPLAQQMSSVATHGSPMLHQHRPNKPWIGSEVLTPALDHY